uniref:Protein S100-B n=1 Tax=Castor canadensis TaxID=51338 RepID=A0A8C0WQ39_CASCN
KKRRAQKADSPLPARQALFVLSPCANLALQQVPGAPGQCSPLCRPGGPAPPCPQPPLADLTYSGLRQGPHPVLPGGRNKRLTQSTVLPLRLLQPETHRRQEVTRRRMSELEKAMVGLIDVFHQYSGREGDKHKLKKSELKELINTELPHFLEEIKEQEVVDKVMETLDEDGDGECDFQEFMAFIAMVTTACHEFFEHE